MQWLLSERTQNAGVVGPNPAYVTIKPPFARKATGKPNQKSLLKPVRHG